MRKVTNIYLHTSLFVPGLGNISDKLPDPHKTLVDLEMLDNGEEILVTAALAKNNKVSFGIPKSNIKVYTYTEVADKKPPNDTY